MPSEMWIPLLIMIIGFYCFFAVMLMSRARTEVLRRENKTDWVRSLVERY
jgi:heme exporter protein C